MKAFTLFGTENFVYLVLSAILAGFGLLSNSKEAVIGSMLISPLFVPIINANNAPRGENLRQNILLMISSVSIAIAIGFVLGKILPVHNETDEMESRTKWKITARSTLLNVAIPIFCGVVVAVAMKSANIVPVIGAGIAIAFMPPLVNTGIYFSENKSKKAAKSLQLALLNIVLSGLTYTLMWQYVL